METPDFLGPTVGGATGVVTMGAIAKFLLQSWIKRKEDESKEQAEAHKDLFDRTMTALEGIKIELAKMSVRLEHLQESADATAEHGKAIAILATKLEDQGKNLNNLGQKVRSLNGGS